MGSGLALPDDDKYKLKIVIADNEFESDKPKKNEGHFNLWNHRIETTITVPY